MSEAPIARSHARLSSVTEPVFPRKYEPLKARAGPIDLYRPSMVSNPIFHHELAVKDAH
jgi:hypothetical protein